MLHIDREVMHAMRELVYKQPTLPYKVVSVSPETYPSLVSSTIETLPILGEYSEHTIYGEKLANIHQRAWHDAIHLGLHADFSEQGEKRVAVEQCRIAEHSSGILADVLWCDLVGQTQHMLCYGHFPIDQRSFVEWYYNTGVLREF